MTPKFKNNRLCGVLAALVILTGPAPAAVNVNDKPTLKTPAMDTTRGEVNLEMSRGKIVVVSFWATTSEPSMKEVDHLLKIEKEWGPKGLEVIGISTDESADPLTKAVTEMGLTWPQIHDSSKAIANEWAVVAVPTAFLISPKGVVLWRGHPEKIDEQIDRAFKSQPPVLVDAKALQEATAALDKMEEAIKASKHDEAIKLLGNVSAVEKNDGKVAFRMAEVEKQLNDYATRTVTEADQLAKDKKFLEAGTRLLDIQRAMSGTPTGQAAGKKLNQILAMPGARAQLEQVQRARAADDELAAAKKMAADGKKEQAYSKLKQVAATFADTPAANEAKATVEQYEKDDPQLAAKAKAVADESKIKNMFMIAESFKKAGRNDKARDKYTDIKLLYPGTQWAQQAEQEIKALETKKQ
jgi:thiol-disulfide isomerase/thioredoxin